MPAGQIIGTPYSGTHTLGNWQSDNAIDLRIPVGTPLYALADGRVSKTGGSSNMAGRFGGYNFTLFTGVGGGRSYFYTHLKELKVKPGQWVKKGELVGYSGSANGVPHLHLGAEKGDPRKLAGAVTQKGAPGLSPSNIPRNLDKVGEELEELGETAVSETAKAVVNAFFDAFGKDGVKIALYLVLVLGGTALAMAGLARTAGVNASDAAAVIPPARAAKALKGAA